MAYEGSQRRTHEVRLYMYDISYGLASLSSEFFLDKKLDGIWHTSIVVYGKEFYYGRSGVTIERPSQSCFGSSPKKIITLGRTSVPEDCFDDYISGLKIHQFPGRLYKLLEYNCNTFSDVVSKFLVGRGIPREILDIPGIIVHRKFYSEYDGTTHFSLKKLLEKTKLH